MILSLSGLSHNELYGDCIWKSLATVLYLNVRFLPSIILDSSGFFVSKDICNDPVSFVVIFLYVMFLSQLKQCHDSQGHVQPDLPCDPSANVSACCQIGYTCSTNFYCTSSENGYHFVGTCTDDKWHDPACPLPLGQLILPALHHVKSAL